MRHANVEALASTEARNGVVRRSFSGGRTTLAFTTLAPGHTPQPHAHEHEQIVYIISGRARFTVGDEAIEAGPGTLIEVPPGVEHFAETIGDEPCLDLSVFAPRREDYAAEAEA
ncbi:MAG: cupin domain-containing protein [Actinobacteria bacterium]|nr:cupin domain-containing protein [Actinomycetota bacterium]